MLGFLTDGQTIYLILLLLYLSDCIAWISHGSLPFCRTLLNHWHARLPSTLFGTSRKGLVLLNPLPHSASLFVAHPLPFALGESGVVVQDAEGLDHDVLADYAMAAKAEAETSLLRFPGGAVVDCHSATEAAAWRARFAALAMATPEARAMQLERLLDERLDLELLKARLNGLRQDTRHLSFACEFLFLALLVACPVLGWRLGVETILLPAAVVAYATGIAIALLAWRIHAQLYPEDVQERWTTIVVMFFFPPAAVRAVDALSKSLLNSFHPLAVARALCSEARFRALAAQTLRHLRYPVMDPEQDSDMQRTLDSARRMELAVLERFLAAEIPSLEELCAAPPKKDANAQSYCPRCHAEFIAAAGCCTSCAGVQLARFLMETKDGR